MAKQEVHVVVYKDADSDQWVVTCLEYDVASQGDSEEHALEMIREALELYLEDLDESRAVVYQAIEGDPKVHKISIDAPSLLHR